MSAILISRVEGVNWTALKEAYLRVRTVLGDKVDEGQLPRWGPEDGGAWLKTETYKIQLSFIHGRQDLGNKSIFEARYYGNIPECDLVQLTEILRHPPLPVSK